jgi:hypothetical protein
MSNQSSVNGKIDRSRISDWYTNSIDGGWWLMQCTKFNGEICGPTIKSIENSLVKSMVQPGIKKNKT